MAGWLSFDVFYTVEIACCDAWLDCVLHIHMYL